MKNFQLYDSYVFEHQSDERIRTKNASLKQIFHIDQKVRINIINFYNKLLKI